MLANHGCYTGQLAYMEESSSDLLCTVHVIIYAGHSAELKVAGSSPAEVHFFLLPKNAAFIQARLGYPHSQATPSFLYCKRRKAGWGLGTRLGWVWFSSKNKTVSWTQFHLKKKWMHAITLALRWQGSHLAEVNENINPGYSQDQGYS